MEALMPDCQRSMTLAGAYAFLTSALGAAAWLLWTNPAGRHREIALLGAVGLLGATAWLAIRVFRFARRGGLWWDGGTLTAHTLRDPPVTIPSSDVRGVQLMRRNQGLGWLLMLVLHLPGGPMTASTDRARVDQVWIFLRDGRRLRLSLDLMQRARVPGFLACLAEAGWPIGPAPPGHPPPM